MTQCHTSISGKTKEPYNKSKSHEAEKGANGEGTVGGRGISRGGREMRERGGRE